MSGPGRTSSGLARRVLRRLAAIDDGTILRTAFIALLAGTAAVLYVDYRELGAADATALAPGRPILPAFDPDGAAPASGPAVTTDAALLEAPLAIVLERGGVLALTGTIDAGAAARFAAAVEAQGEYVETVRLDSPGGSVEDALAIAAAIRDHGFATSVEAGALCASSCPLVFAGGVERRAPAGAAIGLHQVYAAAVGEVPEGPRAVGNAMADAQATTAAVTRHLTSMGVDPALWLHALETPPDRLYYLSGEEMLDLRLVTPPAS